MEELNKTQLILLAIFLSFITSLATGIVTVTLLEQAPVGVTQTINRVVEKTVERVIPGENKTTIKQVYVQAEDPIETSVSRSRSSLVRIELSVPNEDVSIIEPSIINLTGIFVSKDGYILAPAILNEYSSMAITVVDRSGTKYKVGIVETKSKDYSLLKIDIGSKKANTIDFAAKYPSLGSQVIAVGYKSKTDTVEIGRIISVDTSLSTTTPTIASNLGVNVPVISEDGLLIGLNHKDGKVTFIGDVDAVLKSINSVKPKTISDTSSTTTQNATLVQPLINIGEQKNGSN